MVISSQRHISALGCFTPLLLKVAPVMMSVPLLKTATATTSTTATILKTCSIVMIFSLLRMILLISLHMIMALPLLPCHPLSFTCMHADIFYRRTLAELGFRSKIVYLSVSGIGIAQRVDPVEYIKRLLLKRSALSISSAELGVNTKLSMFPESTRDLRHTGDLCWHEYYHMSDVSQTVLPPKRYTRCEPLTGVRCSHEPWAMLQVFSIKLKAYLQDIGSSVKLYGFIAIRDGEDYRRNYLFNRSRADPVTINTTRDYLPLLSPVRGMSMAYECLIEVDIRIKGDKEDVTLVDGCSVLTEGRCTYDTELECTMDDTNGGAIFDFAIFRRAFEATIELSFTKVPTGGMEVKMCGYTALSKNLYYFMDEQCECDRFVTAAGKHPRYFVAAVPFEDTLFLDFMEGKLSVPFKAAVHGSQEKEYWFRNGAMVLVTVSWSMPYY